MGLYSASSLNHQPVGRHVAPLGHISLIPSQPVFVLSLLCGVLSGEATHTNFIVVGFTRSKLEPTIYHIRGEHADNYTTDEPTIYHIRGEHADNYTTDAFSSAIKYSTILTTRNTTCFTVFLFLYIYIYKRLEASDNHTIYLSHWISKLL